MKSIARMALTDGMEIATDVKNYRGDIIIPKGTIVDASIIAKLERNSIICVDIMEKVDYAITHFEKIRLSDNFKKFEEVYLGYMPEYKAMMSDFVHFGVNLDMNKLMEIHDSIRSYARNGEMLLDYLYNMLPDEDDLTHTHCLNSALIAGVFADWMALSADKRKELILCGFLYDIGKLKLSNDILWKPGKLTDLEFMQVKTHTIIGYTLLEKQPISDCFKNCALMHHERCDGTGYPSNLKKDKIELYARYMSIVDSYEAMTSARSYRESLTPLQVIARFESDGYQRYDEELLRPILKRLADSQIGFTVRLNDDTKWEVFIINPSKLSRPILKNGEDLLNLLEHPELDIIAIY